MPGRRANESHAFVSLVSALTFCALWGGSAYAATTASATAQATVSVVASLQISKQSDLNFGTASPGDPVFTVPSASAVAGTTRAQFLLTGAPNGAITIALPPDGTVTMTTSGHGANAAIAVNTFTSTPTSPASLGSSGSLTIFVGATRDALTANQVLGNYSGTFTVTVAYQ